MVKIGQDMSSS